MSVYNPVLGCIFIHVPKTAGTSIEKIVGGGGHQPATDFPQKCFSFAFVRNPWTRLVSAFHHYRDFYREPWTLEEFVLSSKFKLQWRDVVFKEQHKFICVDDEIKVDFVGRFENLHDDWAKVCARLGIQASLPHEMKGKYDFEGHYTPEVWEKVGQIYRKDIELFGYGD